MPRKHQGISRQVNRERDCAKPAPSAKAHGVVRVISKRGFCSRSQAENLVREGRVSLRGKIVRDPDTPARENDEICVDGKPVKASEFVYFMMNKPRGYVTTASDEKGRATVMDLFREQYAKMFPGKPVPHISPVGRLDAASEGLLLFTNDTQWADALLKTKDERRKTRDDKCVERESRGPIHTKIYRVQVNGHPTAEELSQMEAGFNVPPRVFGEPEEFMHAVSAKLYSAGEKNCWLEITLDEGKNREIRRMLAKLGYEVLRLVRIKFCNYELGDLKQGEIRKINLH
ncbi:RNA pseudouridine synthase family protein [Fibrobacter succinogenes subsp. succinogenes S85]|uniref:Pseudouridine synthase n=1 Tax=Fibrobacter succinogenes (strain ATCC 19169 / S85) TaxID=59374 RepID=C9RMB6_FIBSS|nr:pseudouridine synthase [Fibrobacter succinogenes]ACX76148.1 pseudouridine synthase [Fibrobacter succinogenes subsp. succinogenes S85]ADL26356.1 RNA pseudouridine synthase family protein [Fibrobacter succinogenes subsp. succinogenes S85]